MRLSLWRWQCEWDFEDVAQCLGLVSSVSGSSSRLVLVHAKVAKTRARCNRDKKEWMFETNEVASKTELENAVQEFDKQRAAAETRAHSLQSPESCLGKAISRVGLRRRSLPSKIGG